MSNRRRPARMQNHRSYLASGAWAARRRAWYYTEQRRTGQPAFCAVCFSGGHLELHHLTYEGMFDNVDGVWISYEAHEDLVPLCRSHHEQVHKRLDTDPGYRDHLDRRTASLRIIAALRRKILHYLFVEVAPQ